ncbi:site-2 protease family protein [Chitinilyticum piscinae]|uniref:Site-2 protease family protein n=1 Tax=Chitinilyticum piscinae TaxID=2866724 RepID=A0A8J7FKE4_9NEIS|nr:site-2 protease family protein [Chitinilyticum piscinae]MBE9609312.1 site-2 protease family protein [Chitinilyticum piscinae]
MGGFDLNSFISSVCIWAIPVIFAITIHEAAHAYAARYFGDNTAYAAGRLTLNPLKHIDPVGTILLPLLLMAVGGFLFGWAKPVPVRFGNLRNPKRDMRWVAAAGPLSNYAQAFFWLLLLKLSVSMPGSDFQIPLYKMAQAGISINLSLMVLNLLPILPLDGGRILVSLLPWKQAEAFSRTEQYGFWILLGLIASGPLLGVSLLGVIMNPLMDWVAIPLKLLL